MSGIAANDPRRLWVERVLGVHFPETGGASSGGSTPITTAGWAAAQQAWAAAIEAVDAQVTALQAALRGTDDNELHQIADRGLNAITGNHRVPVMAALLEAGDGSQAALALAAAKGLPAVQAFRKHLATDPRVEGCDTNPFGVAMSVRATLDPALAQLEQVFAAAGAGPVATGRAA
jgi:hypothetical protein